MSLKDPKSKEWLVLGGVAGTTDVIQWAADLTGIGAGASEFADPFIGIAIGTWLQLRGASLIKQPKRLISLVASDIAEQISVQTLPAWVLDVWYIHSTVKQEWEEQEALKMAAENEGNLPANREIGGRMMRMPPRKQPANINGTRGAKGNIKPLPKTPTFASVQENEETSLAA